MADQATLKGARGAPLNGNPGPPHPSGEDGHGHGNGKGVVGNLADFGNDVFTLVELQAKLAAADMQAAKARAIPLAGVVGFALLLAIGSIPVALFGVADLLVWAFAIRQGFALLITAGTVMAIAVLTLFLVAPRLARAFEPLRRSREEFIRNVDWVRTVLVYSGRAFPKRK